MRVIRASYCVRASFSSRVAELGTQYIRLLGVYFFGSKRAGDLIVEPLCSSDTSKVFRDVRYAKLRKVDDILMRKVFLIFFFFFDFRDP